MKRINIITKCLECGKETVLSVYESDIEKYKKGGYVQDSFPYLSPGEREMLISGICPNCWDKIFSDTDLEL